MNDYALRSTADAEAVLAALFAECVVSGKEHLRLEVHEDKCFHPDAWVSVGTVSLRPELPCASPPQDRKDALEHAFRYGFFEWETPGRDCLKRDLNGALSIEETTQNRNRISRNVNQATMGVACVAIRCGLAHPTFDAMDLSKMPYRSTVGIVMDTSAVLQGGLDFAARHLTPAARLRVPAIVQMEVLNFADRYLSTRRSGTPSSGMLVDHMSSQAGQRALTRLGLAHRVERPRLGAEPLRGIVQPDSDAEDKSLGLQKVQKSFADRLILETAVQRKNDAAPDHPVMLMTADQGLAKMALAEGIEPIFFDTNAAFDMLGSTLSGVVFKPFATDGPRAYGVSFGAVLWELAVSFGAARLTCIASGDSFEAVALGEGLSWRPYHTRGDLLWTKATKAQLPGGGDRETATDGGVRRATIEDDAEPAAAGAKGAMTVLAQRSRPLSGAYVFSPGSMIDLMVALDRAGLSDAAGMEAARVNRMASYNNYWRFLCAGGFAVRSGEVLQKTDRLSALLSSMADGALAEVRTLFAAVPSFARLLGNMAVGSPLAQIDSGIRTAAFGPYCALAELCCAGVRFADTGIYATPENPTPEYFSRLALDAYDVVRQGEDYVLTGAWLDEMARRAGIHPVRARQRLAEAHQGGYIRRYVEGSTPETRYANRNIHLIGFERGVPVVRSVNLYHGDFLMPGRAAVSIRLSGSDR